MARRCAFFQTANPNWSTGVFQRYDIQPQTRQWVFICAFFLDVVARVVERLHVFVADKS